MLQLLATPVTAFFLVINVLVGAYSLPVEPDLIGRWAFRPAAVRKGEWERWLTAGFVHTGLAHLAFNMITLFYFGPLIEGVLGWWRFLIVYVGSELAANALTYWRHRDDPAYSAVGASGAISGVLFAFVLFAPWEKLYVFFAIPMPAIVFAASTSRSRSTPRTSRSGAWPTGAPRRRPRRIVLTLLLYPAAAGIFCGRSACEGGR